MWQSRSNSPKKGAQNALQSHGNLRVNYVEFGLNKLSKCTVRARTVSPRQSFRAVYLRYVIGWRFQRPFFREFPQWYFRAALSRDICARCLRAVISADVFASVSEAWLPGKGSRNCFLKVVSGSAPRKMFRGNALGNSFRYELPESVFRKCFRGVFLEGISGKRAGIMRNLQARGARNTISGNITGRR